MKNKRLLAILILLFLLTGVVVLGSAVFTVSQVSVKWKSSVNYYENVDETQIVKSVNFDKWQSIFLVNKSNYVTELEKNNPYLHVVGIETVFPNKLVLQLVERQELFALKVASASDDSKFTYIVLDRQLKVLSKQQDVLQFTPKLVVVEAPIALVDSDFVVGEFVSDLTMVTILAEFATNMERFDYDNQKTRLFAKSIVIDQVSQKQRVTINSNFGNLKIVIMDSKVGFFNKMYAAISKYEEVYENDYNHNATITVSYDTQGRLVLDY